MRHLSQLCKLFRAAHANGAPATEAANAAGEGAAVVAGQGGDGGGPGWIALSKQFTPSLSTLLYFACAVYMTSPLAVVF